MNAHSRHFLFCVSAFICVYPRLNAADVASLEKRLTAIIDPSPIAAHSILGIHVVDLKTGKPLFARNESKLFLPASNMKLATTAAALAKLGPDHRFETRIVREPSGDVALIGGGDPTLSFRLYPYQKGASPLNPLHAIEELADQAVALGLTHVDGDIIGDDRLYPWAPYPPTWTQDDALSEDGAPVSALTLNDNVVSITVRHSAQPGDPAILELNPAIEYFAIDNRVVTSPSGEARVRLARRPGSQLLLTGTVPANGSAALYIPVEDPALFAAQALYDALVRRGIPVRGGPVARHRSAADDYTPVEGETFATRRSPPLTDVLQMIDKVSQNLHAELVLRELGRVARHTGTREAGLEEVAGFLRKAGATPDDFRLEDGSGLSRNAQISPRALTRVLASMYASKDKDAWISLLPVGGEDGTLSNRLCCVSGGLGVRAKTGTLARAISLSGYADSKTYGPLAFSILVNNFSAQPSAVRAWIDKMALALVE